MMIATSYYLLKVIIISAVLFIYYWFVLRNKVFHAYNRFYLLAIVVLSIGLPFIKINIFQHTATPPIAAFKIIEAVTVGDEYVDELVLKPTESMFTLANFCMVVYIVVSFLLLLSFILLLIRIGRLYKNNQRIKIENIQIIHTEDAKGTPFSFFKSIFWNAKIDLQSPTGNSIFKHELAHIQEKHSIDKIFINVVLIGFWSNPIFWFLRKELNMIHEFIADKKAVSDGDTEAFAKMILVAAYPQQQFKITNHFFYSPIKRRLSMITKNTNSKVNYLTRVLALPLVVVVFAAFTLKAKNENPILNKTIKVVIDAGHGGTDIGARNTDGTLEKDMALVLAKKIKELNTNDKIEIILTRTEDVFDNVNKKAAFAKEQNADLFIAIHMDAGPNGSENKKSGMHIYIARDSFANIFKSKTLATNVLNSFKNNYDLSVAPAPEQRKSGVKVIEANTFPSILIEAGYINNDKDLAYLKSDKGQTAFANNVLNAINNYAANNELVNLKAINDTPPSNNTVSIKIKEVAPSKETEELLKNLRITEMFIDLDDTRNENGATGVFVINGKEYSKEEINNKTIKGGKATLYKKGSEELIKQYGPRAANGVIIIEKATVTNTEKQKAIRYYKNALTINMDSICVVDANQRKRQLSPLPKEVESNSDNLKINPLIVIDGKKTNKVMLKDMNPEDIQSINVLKGESAIALYGKEGKNGVIEIKTKMTTKFMSIDPILKVASLKGSIIKVEEF